MYGILCAIPHELDALRERLVVEAEAQTFGAVQVWTGPGYALALSGIGKVNAAAAATLLLAVFKADTLIFSGVAGGLNPALAVGDVLFGERLAVHDYGHITAGAFTPTASGVIPIGAPVLSELTAVAPSVIARFEQLKTRLAGRLEARLGTITTADYFLNCAVTRDELHARLGADAIDMELRICEIQIPRRLSIQRHLHRVLSGDVERKIHDGDDREVHLEHRIRRRSDAHLS